MNQRSSKVGLKPLISAAAALSFLKETKSAVTWNVRDLTRSLKVGRPEAEKILAFLGAQGYVKRSGTDWMTTQEGEDVSGAKPPRYTQETVEQAVAALKQQIREASKDLESPFRITHAVAFGDFLLHDRARVQAADVGIGLTLKDQTLTPHSVPVAKMERDFLKQLRGKTALLHLDAYADWMSERSHVDLL